LEQFEKLSQTLQELLLSEKTAVTATIGTITPKPNIQQQVEQLINSGKSLNRNIEN